MILLFSFFCLCAGRRSVGREGDEGGDDELAFVIVAEGEEVGET